MTDHNRTEWKYVPETRTLTLTLPRAAWMAVAALVEQPNSEWTWQHQLESQVATYLRMPLEAFSGGNSRVRNLLTSYFGDERIAAAERAFETACREFAELCQ